MIEMTPEKKHESLTAAFGPISVKTTSGRIEIENQSPITGEDALRLAAEKWPDDGLRYVRWATDGSLVGDDEAIYAGQTVIVQGEVPGDA